MSEHGGLLFPSTVRRQVLDQHVVLRDLLQRTLEQTSNSLLRRALELAPLVDAARDLRRRLHAHLAYEERALAPILAVMDVWGPERVADLLAEHERQRAELETIIEGIETDWDADRVALTLRSFAADLLRDMAEEEQGCLNAQALQEAVFLGSRLGL
jgi:hypothetical protein